METEFQPRRMPQMDSAAKASKQVTDARSSRPETYALSNMNAGGTSEHSVRRYLRQKSRDVRRFTQVPVNTGLPYQAQADKKSRIRKVKASDIQVVQNTPDRVG